MPIKASQPAEDDELELKMTSMIDVVFLLLIFFIVTLQIPPQEALIETELPQATGPGQATAEDEQEREEFEDILLTIRKDANTGRTKTFVSGQWMTTPGRLARRLMMFRNINENGRVVIRCGDDVAYKELVMAISVVQNVELPMAFAGLQ
jgi:biopolymer transport protein ExbD